MSVEIIFKDQVENEKLVEALVNYRKNNTLPQGQVKNKLADIYEELWPENKNWGASKVNRTCPSCISDMMKSLCAHWEAMQVEFKGVPQEEVKQEKQNKMNKAIAKDFTNAPVEEVERLSKDLDYEGTLEEKRENLNFLADQIADQMNDTLDENERVEGFVRSMKWGEFKSFCKEQGLKVKGKKKAELLKELGF